MSRSTRLATLFAVSTCCLVTAVQELHADLSAWTGPSVWDRTDDAGNAPSTQPASESKVPAGVAGKWIYGSISPTSYWDANTGVFVGNAWGAGEILEINADGTFKEYVYIRAQTYNLVTTCWTTMEGRIEFTNDTYTLHVTKGHYKGNTGSRLIDRPMTDEDMQRSSKTYHWRLEKADDGTPRFVVPFDDGSSQVFKPSEAK